MSSEEKSVDNILSSLLKVRGAFTHDIPNSNPTYTIRENQIQMAERIWSAFSEDECILIEAQTGVGKSNGYLVPIILNMSSGEKKPVVISTGTKLLQDQLVKTIPFLLDVLRRPNIKFAVLKGKSNYMCPYKYEKAVAAQQIPRYIYDKCKSAKEVDDLQLTGNATDYAYKVSADEDCLGRKCGFYNKCPMIEARNRAKKADLIITNHHVVMYDVKYPQTGLLPEYKDIVIDEGHNLPSVIASVYSRTISESRVQKLFKEAMDLLPSFENAIRNTLEDAQDLSHMFFQSIMPPTGTPDTSPFLISKTAFDYKCAENLAATCLEAITDSGGKPVRYLNVFQSDDPEEDDGEAITKALKITEKLGGLAKDITFMSKMHKHFAAWAEYKHRPGRQRDKYVVVNYTPLDIGALFQREFVAKEKAVAIVSATLGVGGKANYFKRILGYDTNNASDVEFLAYESPFDYENNTRVFIPPMESKPSQPSFVDECAEKALSLVNLMKGRTLVLCTSVSAMKQMREHIASNTSYKCLMQGDMPTSDLIAQFKKDTHSVLFATKSFWEGVDVPGESLSCVILDKLPFPGQHDPVVKATLEYFEHRNLNSFKAYSVPEAVMLFKQGIGRLIRNEDDKGVIAVLDNRVIDSSYADIFQEALPTANVIRDLGDLEDWLASEQI